MTLRTSVPQDSIIIGVEGLRGDREQRLGDVLGLPFRAAVGVIPMPASGWSDRISDLAE